MLLHCNNILQMCSPPYPAEQISWCISLKRSLAWWCIYCPTGYRSAKDKLCKKKLAEMLKLGIIEMSHCAWCSPYSFWSGSIRLCVDYHKLNEVSQFDSNPMPRAAALIRYCSIFHDAGFDQGLLADSLALPESKEKTAFCRWLCAGSLWGTLALHA